MKNRPRTDPYNIESTLLTSLWLMVFKATLFCKCQVQSEQIYCRKPSFISLFLQSKYFHDKSCHADIPGADSPTIMSCQGYLDLVINIEPLWVMINLVSSQGYSAHEPEGLVEVLEDELLVDGVPVIHHGPA